MKRKPNTLLGGGGGGGADNINYKRSSNDDGSGSGDGDNITVTVQTKKKKKIGLVLGRSYSRMGSIVVYKIERGGLFDGSGLEVGQKLVSVNDVTCSYNDDDGGSGAGGSSNNAATKRINKIIRTIQESCDNGGGGDQKLITINVKAVKDIAIEDFEIAEWESEYERVTKQRNAFRVIVFFSLLIITAAGIIHTTVG